ALELEIKPTAILPPAKTILANIEITAIFSFTPVEVCPYKTLAHFRQIFIIGYTPSLLSRKNFFRFFLLKTSNGVHFNSVLILLIISWNTFLYL
ncbi:hypothetical protein COT93_00380, partial [Candidatus Falkowbacteria bacterium CG10_big_fil_rev_8_21_14_0_10_37_18]